MQAIVQIYVFYIESFKIPLQVHCKIIKSRGRDISPFSLLTTLLTAAILRILLRSKSKRNSNFI